jgi:hypothetical protein
MASITYESPTLSSHGPAVAPFLSERPEVNAIHIAVNFKGAQKTGIPHGTQVRLEGAATVAKTLLPEDQGSCVALFKITNFDELEHMKKLQNSQLNDKFLAATGKGPTFENTYCDALAFDLGREKSDWQPFIGAGTAGVVSLNGKDEWGKKHYVAVVLPDLPMATDACVAISGRAFDDFTSHHYLSTVLPQLIQRNVRKLAAAYADAFDLTLDHEPDALGSRALPKVKACCYDPVVHVKDSKKYIGSKILKSCNGTNIVLISPHVGLETNHTSYPAEIPFGVSHVDSKKNSIGDKAEAYYNKIAHWPGKDGDLHKKLKSRVYNISSAQTFYESNPRADRRRTYRWIAMTMGKK